MRCLFYSYCEEPKFLCCNFCSDKKCEKRCLDNHTNCRFYEDKPLDFDKDTVNHVIRHRRSSSKSENNVFVDGDHKTETQIPTGSKPNDEKSKSKSKPRQKKTESKKQVPKTTSAEKVVLF